MFEKPIFLVTVNGAVHGDDCAPDVERLVTAADTKAARQHVVSIQRASAADVARLMAAGVKVEAAADG